MPDPNPIPDKRFFKASEVCQITDTQPYVLRFWQSEFPQLRPERGVYRREDVDLVLRIKQLLYEEEFTIDGARRQLEQEQGDTIEAIPHEVVVSEPAAEPADDRRSTARSGEAGALGDTVPRARYEDAVEEVADLRLKLQEAESQVRRAEARARKADERAHSALSRLEKLLESLG